MSLSGKIKALIEYEGEIEACRLSSTSFRVGYCSQCGECCKSVTMDTKGSPVAIEWLELHGVYVNVIGGIIKDSRESPKEFSLSITFPCQCKELKYKEEDNTYYCNIYERRPVICKGYPRRQTNHKTCTYIFLNTEELKQFSEKYIQYWRNKDGQEKKVKLTN